jgi:hypothetical protein
MAAIVRCPLRTVRPVPLEAIRDLVDEAVDQGRLGDAEADELLRAAAFVRARDDEGELVLVVEVSRTVDRHDVQRAVRRAQLLRLLGQRVRPAVAGERFTQGAQEDLAAGTALGWPIPREGRPAEP